MTELTDKIKVNITALDATKAILLIIVVGYALFLVNKISNKFDGPSTPNANTEHKLTETEILQIADNVIKARVGANNDILNSKIDTLKTSNDIMYNETKKNSEKIIELGTVVGIMKGSSTSDSGTFTKPAPSDPSKDYADVMFFQNASDGTKLPLGRLFYSPNVVDGDKWATQTFPIRYKANVMSTISKDGVANRYVELWAENDFVPSARGKRFPIKIEKAEWVMEDKSENSFRVNPRIALESVAGMDESYPALSLSMFSYGKTKRDMLWRFLDVSAGGSKSLAVGLTPFSYNVGNNLPLVDNLFVGPTIKYDFNDSKYTGAISVSIPF